MTSKRLQAILKHNIQTAYYKCIICAYTPAEPKAAALPATLPAFHEEWCPKCRADRRFIKVK